MSELVVSEAQRVEYLSALVACDGMPKIAAKRLAGQGIDIRWQDLKALRERHAGVYQALAVEHARTTEEAMVVEFRELARLGQRATRQYLEDLVERQEAGELTRDEERAMPQVIQAMQKVVQVSTDKLLSLTGRPTDGGSNDPLAAAKWLIDAGVLQPVERPELEPAVEGTAEEVK